MTRQPEINEYRCPHCNGILTLAGDCYECGGRAWTEEELESYWDGEYIG